jgi:hypothetical protein
VQGSSQATANTAWSRAFNRYFEFRNGKSPPFPSKTSSVSPIGRYLKDLLKGGLFAGTADSIFNPTRFIKGIVPKKFFYVFPIFFQALIVTL